LSELFPRVICLTLPEQRERQLAVVREFERVGIHNYEFHPGFSPACAQVTQAYEQNRVRRYPDCFRCGRRDCGNPDCNNVLLPAQVAVVLGFQAILDAVAKSEQSYAAVCEDDIVFAGCAARVLASARFKGLLESSGLFGDTPVLIRLGRPRVDQSFLATGGLEPELRLTDEVVMSNYFFLVNRAFARLAVERLNRIDHTADMIIHHLMSGMARCQTLNIQLVADRSWSLGEVPSLIHPKAHHLAYLRSQHGESSSKTAAEAERIRNHVKKAVTRTYCFTGSPRCGSHFVSAFLRGNGLDIGHEGLGRDGICAWQFAVSSSSYPYISDRQAKSDFFVHADHWFVYARNPSDAIPSLIVENQKAPLSYAFRREAIHKASGVNLDDFATPVERAARAYAHWYQLALQRQPKAVLRVEHFLEDCRQSLPGHDIKAVAVPAAQGGAGKPYLGVVHKPQVLETGWMERLSRQTWQTLREVSAILGYKI
jgi:hypothetical protein